MASSPCFYYVNILNKKHTSGRILLICDDPVDRENLTDMLAPLHCQLYYATIAQIRSNVLPLPSEIDLIIFEFLVLDLISQRLVIDLKKRYAQSIGGIILIVDLEQESMVWPVGQSESIDIIYKPINRHELRRRVGASMTLKQYRQALQTQESIADAIQNIEVGLIGIDGEQNIVLSNRLARRLLYKGKDEDIHANWRKLLHTSGFLLSPALPESLNDEDWEKTEQYCIRASTLQSPFAWVKINLMPQDNNDNNPIRIFTLIDETAEIIRLIRFSNQQYRRKLRARQSAVDLNQYLKQLENVNTSDQATHEFMDIIHSMRSEIHQIGQLSAYSQDSSSFNQQNAKRLTLENLSKLTEDFIHEFKLPAHVQTAAKAQKSAAGRTVTTTIQEFEILLGILFWSLLENEAVSADNGKNTVVSFDISSDRFEATIVKPCSYVHPLTSTLGYLIELSGQSVTNLSQIAAQNQLCGGFIATLRSVHATFAATHVDNLITITISLPTSNTRFTLRPHQTAPQPLQQLTPTDTIE